MNHRASQAANSALSALARVAANTPPKVWATVTLAIVVAAIKNGALS